MKKLALALIVFCTIGSVSVKADEGMWLVHLIGERASRGLL